jgi:hypothetical protein
LWGGLFIVYHLFLNDMMLRRRGIRLAVSGEVKPVTWTTDKTLCEHIGTDRVNTVSVSPFATPSHCYDNLILYVDEEAKRGKRVRSNRYASLFHDPERPNDMMGDAVLTGPGLTETEVKDIMQHCLYFDKQYGASSSSSEEEVEYVLSDDM